jgi:hypothetical protein
MCEEKWSKAVFIWNTEGREIVSSASEALLFLSSLDVDGTSYRVAVRMLMYNVRFRINNDFGRMAFIRAMDELGIRHS